MALFDVTTNVEQIGLQGAPSVTLTNSAGDTLYYADNNQVSSTSNQGNVTAGNSVTFTQTTYVRSASRTTIQLAYAAPSPVVSALQVGPGAGATGGNATQDTQVIVGTTITDPDVTTRPVGQEWYDIVAPAAAPTTNTDYHGFDLQLVVNSSSANVNSHASLYAIEAKSSHFGSQTLNNIIGGLAEAVIQTGGGSATNAISFKVFNQVLNGGTATNSIGLQVLNPTIDGTSTVTNAYGIYITGFNALARTTLALAFYVHDGISRFNDVVQVTNVFTAGVGLTVNSTNSINTGQFAAVMQGFDFGVQITTSQAQTAGSGKQTLNIQNSAGTTFSVLDVGSVVISMGSALATTAVDGFVYIPQCAGAPTGVPTTHAGGSAMVYDTTNNKIWVYNGAWRGVVVA